MFISQGRKNYIIFPRIAVLLPLSAFLAVFYRPSPWAAAIAGGEKDANKTKNHVDNSGFTLAVVLPW